MIGAFCRLTATFLHKYPKKFIFFHNPKDIHSIFDIKKKKTIPRQLRLCVALKVTRFRNSKTKNNIFTDHWTHKFKKIKMKSKTIANKK